MIGQAGDGSLAQPLQLVGFMQRLSSLFYFLADAGTLRLGKILRGLDVTNSSGCFSVNLQRDSVGKDGLIEVYIRNAPRREIATQNLPCMSWRLRDPRNMSFDRRAFWNRDSRTRVYRLYQLCRNWLAGLGDAYAFLKFATKIITCSDLNRAL